MHSIYNYQIQTQDWDNLKHKYKETLIQKHYFLNFENISLKNNSVVLIYEQD
jgi:hypothetical protein